MRPCWSLQPLGLRGCLDTSHENAIHRPAAALIRQIVQDVARYVIRALPLIIKAFAVGGGLAGATIAVYQTWETFGQDPAALILGFAVGCVPFLYAMTRGIVSFGGLLASGSVSAVIGLTFWLLPLLLSNLLIIFGLGTLLVLQMARRNISEDTSHEI